MSRHLTWDTFLNICHFSLGFPLEQARKRGYDYADISEEKLGIPEDTLDGSFYEKPNFPRLSPDLTYGV